MLSPKTPNPPGRTDPLFEEPAIQILRQLGHGLPRKMGNLATAAMTLAMANKSQAITAERVVKASEVI
jgi:type II secretory pathway predicted ATPase ExeA